MSVKELIQILRLAMAAVCLVFTFSAFPSSINSSQIDSIPIKYDTIAGDLPSIINAGTVPYLVAGDVYVPSGKTVTIEAGTTFLFKNFTGLHVQGRVLVKGTQEHPVIFTSENDKQFNRHESPEAAPYDWNGIHIYKEGAGSELNYCLVQYAVEALVSESRFIRLSPCMLKNNGRINLIIDGIEHAVGNEPYEYALSVKDAKLDGIALSVLSDPLARRRNVCRYAGFAVAVAGGALGFVMSENYVEASERLKGLSSRDDKNLAANTSADWNDARNNQKKMTLGLVAGWGAAIVGAIGVGVSFTF